MEIYCLLFGLFKLRDLIWVS